MANLFISLLLSVSLGLRVKYNNGLGHTPQMGWNSWNHFGCKITEDTIKQAADALVSEGLLSLGYEYVNIDDCWSSVNRTSDGKLQADPSTFPNGIRALADYVHSKGLKLGIYSDAGKYTCQKRPGSLDNEPIDAQTFADWQVDYLKYDNCYNEKVDVSVRYPAMSKALNATGRPIFYSICNWGQDDTTSWAPAIGNSWRTTLDIKDLWFSMKHNFLTNAEHPEVAGPGGWNDPDMLEVGNGVMSNTEYISHFSLWALVKAPLIIGCDLTSMSEQTKNILMNTEVIAVNQDKLGAQGYCVSNCDEVNRAFLHKPEVWIAPMENKDLAVVIINWSEFSKGYTLSASTDLKSNMRNMAIRDLWLHKDLGTFQESYNVGTIPSHGVKMFRITLS